MLNKSGKSWYPCLLPNFRGNAFTFSPLSMMLAVGLSYMTFINLEVCSLYAHFLEVFIINGYWILSKAFSASTETIMWFLFFNLLMWCITLIELVILKNPSIPGINPTWSWCMILLMYCWNRFASILLRILYLCSSVILACNFLFCDIFVWFWYQGDGGLIEWFQKCSFLCSFLD